VKIYKVKIDASKAQYRLLEAVKTGLYVLRLLGMRFPEKPNKLNILLYYLRTRFALMGRKTEDLIDLPEISDPIKAAIMMIMSRVGSATYFATPKLMSLFVFEGVKLSARYGTAPSSAFFYAVYGMALCGVVGNIERGYRFGRLALNMLERSDAIEQKASICHLVNAFTIHWKEHVRKTIEPLSEGFQSGLETGDFEYAAHCAFFHSYHSFVSGEELSVVEQIMVRYSNALIRLKQQITFYWHEIYRQTVSNLMGQSEDPSFLIEKYYDERCMLPDHQEVGDRTTLFIFYLTKLLLSYLFCEYPKAIENGSMAEKYLDGVIGFIGVPLLYFYDSLARLAVYSSSEKPMRRRIMRKVSAGRRKMKKWAHHAPMNHLHRFYLIEAERLRVLGRDAGAEDRYDRAIELARENLYVNDEALANELAAKFYLARGKTGIARAYMQDARRCYRRWGAAARSSMLSVTQGI
jgi:Predicted ATPase